MDHVKEGGRKEHDDDDEQRERETVAVFEMS